MLKLVCYDIENNRLRTRLAKYLERHGLVRVQLSVFVGTLKAEQWQKLWNHVALLYHKSGEPGDTIYCITLSKTMFRTMQCLGEKVDMEYILDEIHTLYL